MTGAAATAEAAATRGVIGDEGDCSGDRMADLSLRLLLGVSGEALLPSCAEGAGGTALAATAKAAGE